MRVEVFRGRNRARPRQALCFCCVAHLVSGADCAEKHSDVYEELAFEVEADVRRHGAFQFGVPVSTASVTRPTHTRPIARATRNACPRVPRPQPMPQMLDCVHQQHLALLSVLASILSSVEGGFEVSRLGGGSFGRGAAISRGCAGAILANLEARRFLLRLPSLLLRPQPHHFHSIALVCMYMHAATNKNSNPRSEKNPTRCRSCGDGSFFFCAFDKTARSADS